MGPDGTWNQEDQQKFNRPTDRLALKGLSRETYLTVVTLVSTYCRKEEGREKGRLANFPPEGDEPCLTDGPA
jgi:hypothetical protein